MKVTYSNEDERSRKRIDVLSSMIGERYEVHTDPCELAVNQLNELEVLIRCLGREVQKLKTSLAQS